MKKQIFKGILFFLIGFFVFLGFRMIYGYFRYSEEGQDLFNVEIYSHNDQSFESDGNYRKNIASTKYENTNGKEGVNASTSNQKYEKIGSLSSTTSSFEDDEKKTRTIIQKYNALIQYEQRSGMEGNRRLQLIIGVPPDKFESSIKDIKSLGHLEYIQIDKVDKTNEYKELNAQRISLEKTIESLSALKSKSGNIDEYVNLEQQILGYERELQELGVQLGDFDEENEFCTIKFYLNEEGPKSSGIPFLQRLMVALEWTLKYYFLFLIIIGLAALSSFLIIKVVVLIRNSQKNLEKK